MMQSSIVYWLWNCKRHQTKGAPSTYLPTSLHVYPLSRNNYSNAGTCSTSCLTRQLSTVTDSSVSHTTVHLIHKRLHPHDGDCAQLLRLLSWSYLWLMRKSMTLNATWARGSIFPSWYLFLNHVLIINAGVLEVGVWFCPSGENASFPNDRLTRHSVERDRCKYL